ncbi:MAG: hypothetical protein FDZ70_02520 [Actinobacteria bacterium]|nr:MAG: hypothetical protein FDZ70_02520 [Actinomycetota bacterium]
MGFLEDVGKGLSDLGQQAGDALKTGSKQLDLTTLQSQIKDAYASLGQAVYVKRANGAVTLDAETEAYAAAVDELRTREAALKAEIEAEKSAPPTSA